MTLYKKNACEDISQNEVNQDPAIMSVLRDEAILALNQMIMSSPDITNKKDISWERNEYQEKVKLQDLGARSQPYVLDRRASVGPCFRAGMPFCRPSGITLCLPRKCTRNVDFGFSSFPSGINITVSKKNLAEQEKAEKSNKDTPENCPKDPFFKFVGILRAKIDNTRGRIKNYFNV